MKKFFLVLAFCVFSFPAIAVEGKEILCFKEDKPLKEVAMAVLEQKSNMILVHAPDTGTVHDVVNALYEYSEDMPWAQTLYLAGSIYEHASECGYKQLAVYIIR